MLAQEPRFGTDRGWSESERLSLEKDADVATVINIASVLSFGGMPGSISYVASKGAVMQMTKTASRYGELGSPLLTAYPDRAGVCVKRHRECSQNPFTKLLEQYDE